MLGPCLPFGQEEAAKLLEARRRLEDLPDDELWRDRPVPVVGLQAEGDVVATGLPVAVEGGAASEGDRPGACARCGHGQAKVLALADGRELGELGTDCQQRHVRVPEPEGRQPLELLAEAEGELAPAHHRVDVGDRLEVCGSELAGGVLGEGLREGLDVRRCDGEAGRSPVSAPATEQVRAGAEGAVQVEGGHGPP